MEQSKNGENSGESKISESGRNIESRKDGKKSKSKKPLIFALLAVFLFSLAVTFLPFGAGNVWHKVFSFFGLNDFSDAADAYPMSMHVFNVGKADSILIESDGHYMLVDGGTADCGDEVSRCLKKRGVKALDIVVNTHPDDDHIGGLYTVIQNFPIGEFLAPDIPKELIPKSTEYTIVQKALQEKHLTADSPKCGEIWTLGKMKMQVLAPIKQHNSTNNNSIVLRLTYGKTVFLLMGDAEQEEESDLLASRASLSADVLKVGHHGSTSSTTQAFLNAVKPRYAAISVGKDSNNLPKAAVLKRLSAMNTEIFRTDVSGTLIFMSNGEKIKVQTEKQ